MENFALMKTYSSGAVLQSLFAAFVMLVRKPCITYSRIVAFPLSFGCTRFRVKAVAISSLFLVIHATVSLTVNLSKWTMFC